MNTSQPEFRHIQLTALAFSTSPAQAARRKLFNKAKLDELATSIREKGVLQPIVVRRLTDGPSSKGFTYELVAGERRVMAARLAKLLEVPGMVCDLTDDQAQEIQLIENLQREDLHELVEAEGYEVLAKRGMAPEDIAAKVGKSKSTVYARMKLLALGDKGRAAFHGGEISASIALLVARIPVHELQERAIAHIQKPNEYAREPLSFRDAQRYVQDEFTLKLAGAPFPREDVTLCPKAGACGACPKRTGNQPADLFGDIKSADVCTDPVCFRGKRDAHQKRELEKARVGGSKVIGARQARSIIPRDRGYMSAYSSDGSHKHLKNGYARPSDKCLDDPKKRTYAELAGKDAPTVLIQDPDSGRVFKAFELDAIEDRIKAKGVKFKQPENHEEQRKVDREREAKQREQQLAADIAVFQAVLAAAPPKFQREDLEAIAVQYFEDGYGEDELRFRAIGWEQPKGKRFMNEDAWRKCLAKLSDAELTRLIIVLPSLSGVVDSYGETPELDQLAKRLGVDAKEIRKATKATTAAAAEKPEKKSKKAKK